MEIFLSFTKAIGKIPAFVPFILVPCVLVAAAVLFTLFGGRKHYPKTALALGALGFFFVGCKGDIAAAALAAALYAVLACLLSLLFLIRAPFAVPSKEEKRRKREQTIYNKFRDPLVAEDDRTPDVGELPPLASPVTAEESGASLNHACALLEKLKREKLSPTDRLETDALSRTVEGYRQKSLNANELRILNDCLASVLKLTAKYKL